ncbi:hypothetical protein [Streptomyces umbrinus]|uniref:hypothetical protein n=1 Tax=Streptomyces umbrinus TaxID=67370 RepID=UPI0035711190
MGRPMVRRLLQAGHEVRVLARGADALRRAHGRGHHGRRRPGVRGTGCGCRDGLRPQ